MPASVHPVLTRHAHVLVAVLNSKWRGSFSLLAAIMKISARMLGLEERMKGPRYDVFGPWPVCPAHVVDMYS